ncbi:hypothetical protein [Labrenzia sp. PHM005]|nr:hypothetical protein [Labrenzia sp. PHM005]
MGKADRTLGEVLTGLENCVWQSKKDIKELQAGLQKRLQNLNVS